MKMVFGLILSLAFSTQVFASGKIYISGKDRSDKNIPRNDLRIFSVATPLEGKFDYLTIQASAADGQVSVVKIHKSSLRDLQMDVASFMSLTTSSATNPIVMCLEAELENQSYVCRRLSVNAAAK